MAIRSIVALAVPPLLALALLQPQGAPPAPPEAQPSAEQIHTAVQLAEAGAGLHAAVPRGR
jgi:hypothetical protein